MINTIEAGGGSGSPTSETSNRDIHSKPIQERSTSAKSWQLENAVLKALYDLLPDFSPPHESAEQRSNKEFTVAAGFNSELTVGPLSATAGIQVYISTKTGEGGNTPEFRTGWALLVPDLPKLTGDLGKGKISAMGLDASLNGTLTMHYGDFENSYLGRSQSVVGSVGPVSLSRQLSPGNFGMSAGFGPGVGGKLGFESNITERMGEFNAHDFREVIRQGENRIRSGQW